MISDNCWASSMMVVIWGQLGLLPWKEEQGLSRVKGGVSDRVLVDDIFVGGVNGRVNIFIIVKYLTLHVNGLYAVFEIFGGILLYVEAPLADLVAYGIHGNVLRFFTRCFIRGPVYTETLLIFPTNIVLWVAQEGDGSDRHLNHNIALDIRCEAAFLPHRGEASCAMLWPETFPSICGKALPYVGNPFISHRIVRDR